jgi:putative chitinase
MRAPVIIEQIQRSLVGRGYPLSIDGRFGPATLGAIHHALCAANDNGAANDNAPAPAIVYPDDTRLADPKAFFEHLRRGKLLGPVLTNEEVQGCSAIVEACGEDGWPIADVAYALATAYHETAGTMQPVREYGGPAYFTKMYDVTGNRPEMARRHGNTSPGDGPRFCGRGFVQLTWRCNYAKAGAALDVDLVANPDLAMQPAIAAAIMVRGMREGWFTARDLDDDLPRQGPATVEQFARSRDIINGTDKARKIAEEAVTFQAALVAGGWA